MPSNDSGVREITEPVEFAIVGDRLHFTLVSGPCVRTYSISFHKGRRAARSATELLDQHDRQVVVQLPTQKLRRGPPLPHG